MCNGKDCPIKEKCYRYTAPINEFRQSYMDFKYNSKAKKCKDFWDNKK